MPAEKFSTVEVAAYYANHLPEMKQRSSGEWRGPCPVHGGEDPNFSVDPATGEWFCHSQCGKGGSIVTLHALMHGMNRQSAKEQVFKAIGRVWRTTARHVYTDQKGAPLFRVVRRERGIGEVRQKTFTIQSARDGRWVNGLRGVAPVLYRLHKILKTNRVFIAEGEKAADTLRKSLQLIATTNPLGAGKWSPKYAGLFVDKDVIVLPDNDEPGRKHALAIVESLVGTARSVRVIELPGLPHKGDVADWVQSGGDREALLALVSAEHAMDDATLAELRRRWTGIALHESGRSRFEVNDNGVFASSDNADPVWICSRLDVLAQVRDFSGENWGLRLGWRDREGIQHDWIMPFRMLATEAGTVRARLLSGGVQISTAPKSRELLLDYLQTAPTNRMNRCVQRTGWYGDTYVLPDGSISAHGADEEVLYQSPCATNLACNQRGTLEEWQRRIGKRCAHNSRLIAVVSCGFAGPLLSLVGAESGGVHLPGATSIGSQPPCLLGDPCAAAGGILVSCNLGVLPSTPWKCLPKTPTTERCFSMRFRRVTRKTLQRWLIYWATIPAKREWRTTTGYDGRRSGG